MMKKTYIIFAGVITMMVSVNSYAQTGNTAKSETKTAAKSKSDPDVKAEQFVAALNLTDTAKASQVKAIITTHLTAVRDWHNNHAYTLVPEGLNPITGKIFTKADRQFIVDSTIPKTVHETLMAGLRQYLTDDQVELILDKYTIGKVAFTMNGYKSIVPDMKPAEEAFILTNLKQAREQAIDYKNVEEISTVFKIYKTKIEDYFNSNGRNWKVMYKTYVDQVLAKKAIDKNAPAADKD
ncbi:DUF3826 domain-containing protein [Mucilaginibacter sp. X5P1]|uniref:DUF3826 domain-containing protein n=1 Tax=Mucilaginibacter sp. X5P1 TaxID=2723088 RepID=UPI003AFFA1D0